MNLLTWVFLDATPAPKPIDKSRVEPGWIALAFLVALGAVVVFLWFSMRKQLGRIDVGRHQRERAARQASKASPSVQPTVAAQPTPAAQPTSAAQPAPSPPPQPPGPGDLPG